ncbi:MAG: hypothetical protein ACK4WB_09420, partial [Desulfatiglandales bacterium]
MDPHIKITGIGSVPYRDSLETSQKIIQVCPLMPFWPQMVKVSPQEEMMKHFVGVFDSREELGDGGIKIVEGEKRAASMASFYEKALGDDLSAFAISEFRARGLYALVRILKERPCQGGFVKGQVIGPFTLALGVKDSHGRNGLNQEEVWEAIVEGIKKKIHWQAEYLGSTGRRPVVFLDEPGLSGYGSAFSTLSETQIVDTLSSLAWEIKSKRDILMGIHCCGNTDWGILLRTGVDIISLDTYGFSESFFLYPNEIKGFLERGGIIALGYIPTSGGVLSIPVDSIAHGLRECLKRFYRLGFDRDRLMESSIFTPACGMGSLSPQEADKVLEILSMTESFLE